MAQEVSVPEVRKIELKVAGVFFVGDQGELAEAEKVAEIRAAVAGVPGLENVEVEVHKLFTAEETAKEAAKDEKADHAAAEKQAKADAKAAEEAQAASGEVV